MDNEIINNINALLTEEFELEPGQITPDADLKNTLDLDSLDYIDLVALTESNFGFKMKPEDFNDIVTFKDFYAYIDSNIKKKEVI
jgi:acyl carrier protein